MLTDPVWWFDLTWLPSYLERERGVTLASAAGALLVIYLAADLGSVFGGWLPGYFLRRGWSGTRARLATMALFAVGLPISALGVMAKDLWTAVAFISIATACHQAWSANMFTVASDAFPNCAIGSVVGSAASAACSCCSSRAECCSGSATSRRALVYVSREVLGAARSVA